ncbi:hypothetical protein GCM10017764_23360 [Sphingobacterium griseoflavum]|uniref:DUF5008 domain-containing protein n=2 Tax=Sphingobacterium griseoflavum TaxID=1474952 RepID=A0ABQ3HVR9_9SPHI|nr:hypothetical protein GCM10017764_23360 [Sphingobacterium griseoflavum]
MIMKLLNVKIVCLPILFLLLTACSKDLVVGEDPYAGGKGSLGIGFVSNYPSPEVAKPGELVEFQVKGLLPYIGQLNFFVNNTPVEVISAEDSLVIVRVPTQISSGDAKIVVENQVFYGPRLQIQGNVSFDANYGIVNGFNGFVSDFIPNAGGYIVVGAFTNFEDEANNETTFIRGIHFIDANGRSSSSMNFGKGAYNINSIARMSSGAFVVGGAISSFNDREVYGIAKLLPSGRLDTMVVDVINTTEFPQNSLDTVSSFNGGVTGGSVLKVFGVADDKVIAVGNFTRHLKIDYTYSSRETRRPILTSARNIVRLKSDGTLDSTYSYNHEGANGAIADAVQMPDDKIVLVGTFSRFNGKAAPGIVRLHADGTVDESFAIGTGAARIQSISYNPQVKKFVVTGSFTTFNGTTANGVAVLNETGSKDGGFVLGDIGAGVPTYGYVLNNGKVLLDGTFETYNGVPRSNLLVLEANGSMLQLYNSFSPFSGALYKVVETTSSLGNPALLLGGAIFGFDGHRAGRLIRVEIKN